MSEYTMAERFAVPCPRCNATVGEPCFSPMGNYVFVHIRRSDAAFESGLGIVRDLTPRELREYNRRLARTINTMPDLFA